MTQLTRRAVIHHGWHGRKCAQPGYRLLPVAWNPVI
jgi:hypothetical protein